MASATPYRLKDNIQLGQQFCGALLASAEPEACQTKMNGSTQGKLKRYKPVESGHFKHCLFALYFFLCPVEGHDENIQAASAQATKRDNVCLC